ncbi:MAG: amidohydrolase [Pseudomonadota bacterium]
MVRLTSTVVASATTLLLAAPTLASETLQDKLATTAASVTEDVIALRRHFHEFPELSNEEYKTAERIAEELRAMGLEPTTGIAETGVTALIKGGKPGPLVALRADMDALPVIEQVDLPFASKQRGVYNGNDVGIMHACGHDTHMAMLLGAAQTLVAHQDELPGDVLLIFQPAEEGAPHGTPSWGAKKMLEEGIFDERKPDAIFGLHTFANLPAGMVAYRSGPAMASSDRFSITVSGRQTHGSRPWNGVDPIVVASQIVMAVQTIASRQVDVTKAPSVISFGIINGGVRNNIIPDTVELVGTIRNFDMGIREQIHAKLRHTAVTIADSAGASAEVNIDLGYPVTVNNEDLTAQMLPTVQRVFGDGRVLESPLVTGAEDFSYFAQETPGLFLFLGGAPEGADPAQIATNHSPLFFVDESTLPYGVNVLAQMVADFMIDATTSSGD